MKFADTGLISTRTLRDFDALCLPPVKRLTTVQKWERGEKKPNGPSLKLLDIVARK